ncbi:MAG: zinc ribbon domain-containing protein [Chloroflexi bacterium]|nr:zinc ribbon domain-containing protein [Chloroflexota bacterium]MDA1219461.1 zinc ribbon domain-containing protein [Chloroflexota bacterium]PKB57733.1 MAG: hypothetical protein BZY73_01690 [SAR202 cluster bacterium Casp-Chloro-G3]
MPLYEYYCAKCNAEFEALRLAAKSDDPIACKTCGENGERQLSTFSFKSNTFTAPKLKLATKPRRSYTVEESTEEPTESPPNPS